MFCTHVVILKEYDKRERIVLVLYRDSWVWTVGTRPQVINPDILVTKVLLFIHAFFANCRNKSISLIQSVVLSFTFYTILYYTVYICWTAFSS